MYRISIIEDGNCSIYTVRVARFDGTMHSSLRVWHCARKSLTGDFMSKRFILRGVLRGKSTRSATQVERILSTCRNMQTGVYLTMMHNLCHVIGRVHLNDMSRVIFHMRGQGSSCFILAKLWVGGYIVVNPERR